MEILRRSRWHVLNPAAPEEPDRWVQQWEQIARQLAGLERSTLKRIWDWVQDTFFGAQGQQARANAEAFQQTLARYVRSLPLEAKRHLARHNAVLLVAPDLEGVRRLRIQFGLSPKTTVAFVKYEKSSDGKLVTFFVVNGTEGRSLEFVHLHELAHMVDYDPMSRQRITKTQEWLQLPRREKILVLRSSWEDPGTLTSVRFEREAFAHALAWCWFRPRVARAQTPELYMFFKRHGLVH